MKIMSVATNLVNVMNNIENACNKVNRDLKDVTLIAVSKTKPNEMIMEAYNEGYRNFGENKAQEMKRKKEELPDDINWHFIGHLQTNKVKYVVGNAVLIHSVDSLHLAEAISKESVKKNVISDILIEVNVAKEETKFGLSLENTENLVREIATLQNIRVKGLMTIAPYTENPESNREIFRNLRELLVDIKAKNIDNVSMDFLSMGMTGDYMVAIEEGANFVRVGTGIFGERNYSI
ncbi:MAG: YggS family pyridoxal phosphate-dependent enzyme [Lachnospiraceae bacterium]|nr:YggS family pyridoxal phosphate-dependent enzyme [Lachnospiraceae bacterium]